MADPQTARVYPFPDLKPARRRDLLGPEIGTQFDLYQRLFAADYRGDVFDYGEWAARDMKTMFRRDGQAQAVELVLTLPIREAGYSIEKQEGDTGEADLANEILLKPDAEGGTGTSMELVIAQATSGQIFKKAFFETVWKFDGQGRIVFDKIANRPAATCQIRRDEKTAALKGFRQQVWMFGQPLSVTRDKTPGYKDIPRIRSAIYIHGQHREPLTGTSEMEVAYWCYQTKMKLLFLWYQFLENQSLPRLIVYGNDPSQANTNADSIAALKSSGVVGIERPPDNGRMFDVISSGTAADQMFQSALGFLENWQIGSVLAGFMGLTGSATGGRGSYALSQDQSAFYLKSRQAVAKEIASWVTHELIRPLVVLNKGPDAKIPRFMFGPLQDEQAQSLLNMFSSLAVAPSLRIPDEILDLITERMASVLQLDVDAVHAAIEKGAKQREEQAAEMKKRGMLPGMPPGQAAGVGRLAGGVGVAAQIAQRAIGQQGAPRPPAKPPQVPPQQPGP